MQNHAVLNSFKGQEEFLKPVPGVVNAFLFFHESAAILTWRNRFRQYSIHSLMDTLCSSKMVPVVGKNVFPQFLHIYRCTPLCVYPLFRYFSRAQ